MADSLKNCYIASGTLIKGTVTSREDLRIDGTVIGNINATGRTIIGTEGKVEGELKSNTTEVSGQLTLEKIQTDSLKLNSTAQFNGNIEVRELMVESGAVINGSISMKGGSSNTSSTSTSSTPVN